MLTPAEDVEAHALRKRGWTITAIANHLGKDRKTIRAYPSGQRTPGERAPLPDPFERFRPYLRARLADDPHIPATALYDELAALGLDRSYPSFTRMLRIGELRPVCPRCVTVSGRATIDIVHPPGEETQWGWTELPEAPWLETGRLAHLLVGVGPYSSKTRAVFADAEDQAHLIQALDGVVRGLGGVTDCWRLKPHGRRGPRRDRPHPADLRRGRQILRGPGGGLSGVPAQAAKAGSRRAAT
ncbi:MAG: hypothetical protein ACRD0K_15400 [Egibacteraceae bacterium]